MVEFLLSFSSFVVLVEIKRKFIVVSGLDGY